MKSRGSKIYVVIGTRAQFIKVAPLLRLMMDRHVGYQLIYTAQHRENIAEILEVYSLPAPDVVLSNLGEANTAQSFSRWFAHTLYLAIFQARKVLPEPGILLTHGDTFTAWLAALMGKRAGCVVGHIESGCRSYNVLSPFPEELGRLITFSLSDIYFCADEWAIRNLARYKGLKVNLGANTMLDAVQYALNQRPATSFDFQSSPYGLVSLHRFENIFTRRLTKRILPLLKSIACDHRLIFVLHPTTRERLRALNLYDELNSLENIIFHERFGFVEWIHACKRADFVITDGGSNQEELSYLGVPTLLFRRESERREGLGKNAVISNFDSAVIEDFFGNLGRYRAESSLGDAQPSATIIQTISAYPGSTPAG